MPKVELRFHQLKDAKRYFDILTNPNFVYLHTKAKSVAEEKAWLKRGLQRRKNNIEWRYSVIYDNKLVGSISLKINQFRKFIGEIGYFIDEKYWGKGIATKAVKLIEKEGFKKLGLSRIEILMRPENKASERVAVKSGYHKEGLLKKATIDKEGNKRDAWLYAKTL